MASTEGHTAVRGLYSFEAAIFSIEEHAGTVILLVTTTFVKYVTHVYVSITLVEKAARKRKSVRPPPLPAVRVPVRCRPCALSVKAPESSQDLSETVGDLPL